MRRALTLALLFVLSPLGGASAGTARLADLAKAIEKPALSGGGLVMVSHTIAVGHLELVVDKATLHPVSADGRVVGIFVEGGGKFRYQSGDPYEAATFRTNVDRSTGWDVDRDARVADSFTEALIFSSDVAKLLPAGTTWPVGAAVSVSAAKALAAHVERTANDLGDRAWNRIPQALVEAGGDPVVVAEIAARKKDLQYLFDPLRSGFESLSALRAADKEFAVIRELRFADLLSSSPIGRGRLDRRSKRFALVDLDVDVTNPTGIHAEIQAKETFRIDAATRTIELDLWSNRIGTAGVSAQWAKNDYRLDSVRGPKGEALEFSHLDGEVVVRLPEAVSAGATVTLTFHMSGDVLFNPGNDSYWILPISAWYPVPAREDMQAFRFHAVCRVPKPFVGFSNGRTVRRWEEGELACAEFSEDKPIQFAVVLAGKYSTASETRGSVTVRVSTYVFADEEGKKKMIGNLFAILEAYKPYFGDYPFPELDVVEINDLGWGLAPAGMIFITKEAFNPLQSAATRYYSAGINGRLAHEVAHTWWGHVAKMGSPDDQWLSESVAEYFSAVAGARLRSQKEFDRAINQWRESARLLKKKGSVLLANQLSGTEGSMDRTDLLYAKGPLVLDAYRKKIGDQAFFTIFKSLVSSFAFQQVDSKRFLGMAKAVTKSDQQEWFDKYLGGPDWP